MGRLTQQTLAGKTSQTRSYNMIQSGNCLALTTAAVDKPAIVTTLLAAASPHANEIVAFYLASNIVDAVVGIATQDYINKLLGHIPS